MTIPRIPPAGTKAAVLAIAVLVGVGASAARASAQVDPDVLTPARNTLEAFDYEGTLKEIEPIIRQLDERRLKDVAMLPKLVEALELRARARFLTDDVQGAKGDIAALLELLPGFVLPPGLKAEYEAVFNDVRRETVGELALTIEPPDATFELDGRVLQPPDVLSLVRGSHRLVVTRRGYKAANETVSVEPGDRRDLRVVLQRVTAVLRITTIPAGVEIVVNGVPRGATQPARATGGAPPRATESAPFLLTDLRAAPVLLEFRADCHLRQQRRFIVEALKDYVLEPVVLERADADIEVETDAPLATITLDGEDQGDAPKVLRGVCEGAHTLQVRSDVGLFVRRLEVRAGQGERVRAHLRPAFALLPAQGVAEDRGLMYERLLQVEHEFANAATVTFFVPTAVEAEKALAEAQLAAGWLAVERTGRPLGEAAESLSARARREASALLARTLGVHGIATVNRGSMRDEVVLALLAAGSAEPDVITFSLDDPVSIDAARRSLDTSPPLFRIETGLLLVDALGRRGALVAGVEPEGDAAKAQLLAGDLITQAQGQRIQSASELEPILNAAGPGISVPVQVQRGPTSFPSALIPRHVPSLVAPTDRTILFNKLLAELRARRSQVADETEQAQIALHLAVALMHGGNHGEALQELQSARLPKGAGVSRGTVLYLTGWCQQELGRADAAQQAWQDALTETGSLLTPEGPPIAELVSRERGPGTGSR